MARFEVFFDYYGADTDLTQVHQYAVTLMQEAGLIVDLPLNGLEEFGRQQFYYTVILCADAREACPIFVEEERTSIAPSMILLLK